MINKAEIENLKNWYFLNPDYPIKRSDLITAIMESLGDDEAEILEYIKDGDKYRKSFLALASEEFSKKFTNADEMIKEIKKIDAKIYI